LEDDEAIGIYPLLRRSSSSGFFEKIKSPSVVRSSASMYVHSSELAEQQQCNADFEKTNFETFEVEVQIEHDDATDRTLNPLDTHARNTVWHHTPSSLITPFVHSFIRSFPD
jgi:hypothetical protein